MGERERNNGARGTGVSGLFLAVVVAAVCSFAATSCGAHSGREPWQSSEPSDGSSLRSRRNVADQSTGAGASADLSNLKRLSQDPDCRREIEKNCGGSDLDDLRVLECFQELVNPRSISRECQHKAWKLMKTYTQTDYFLGGADSSCRNEYENLPCNGVRDSGNGLFLACLIDNTPKVTSKQCWHYLRKHGVFMFFDYHLVHGFVTACEDDIEKLECGRLEILPTWRSQRHTIHCLTQNFNNLPSRCTEAVLKLAEQQSEDPSFDRPLYQNCRLDIKTLCVGVDPRGGGVYGCLSRALALGKLNPKCQAEMLRREELIKRDYKISRDLAEACNGDLTEYNCSRAEVGSAENEGLTLPEVMHCLGDAARVGHRVSDACQTELTKHESLLKLLSSTSDAENLGEVGPPSKATTTPEPPKAPGSAASGGGLLPSLVVVIVVAVIQRIARRLAGQS